MIDEKHSDYFQKLTLGVIRSLEGRSGIVDVKCNKRSSSEKHNIINWEQKHSCLMPDDLKNFYLTSNGFLLTWSVKLNDTKIPVGRMEINNIDLLTRIGGLISTESTPTLPDVDLEYSSSNVDEKESPKFDHRSRIFELDPCDGNGKVCLVYNNTKPGIPAQYASIWFMDRSLCWHFLTDTFLEYYRLLITNLGLPQWQYFFTDIGLSPQVKQWYHMFAPLRIDKEIANEPGGDTNTAVNNLDVTKVFKGKSEKKKSASQQQQPKKKPMTASTRNPIQTKTFQSSLSKSSSK